LAISQQAVIKKLGGCSTREGDAWDPNQSLSAPLLFSAQNALLPTSLQQEDAAGAQEPVTGPGELCHPAQRYCYFQENAMRRTAKELSSPLHTYVLVLHRRVIHI